MAGVWLTWAAGIVLALLFIGAPAAVGAVVQRMFF